MEKFLGSCVAVGIALGVLTGCAQTGEILNPEDNGVEVEQNANVSNLPIGKNVQRNRYGHMVEQEMELEDGRVVTCVVYDGYNSGGVSCDWDSANGLVSKPMER